MLGETFTFIFITYFEVMLSTVGKPDFTFYLTSMTSVEFGIHKYDSQKCSKELYGF
jgi:hypothetical protein